MEEPKRLYRSRNDRMLAGVCGGLGAYFGIDGTVVRVLWVLIAVVTGIVPGLVAYAVLALVMPEEPPAAAAPVAAEPPRV